MKRIEESINAGYLLEAAEYLGSSTRRARAKRGLNIKLGWVVAATSLLCGCLLLFFSFFGEPKPLSIEKKEDIVLAQEQEQLEIRLEELESQVTFVVEAMKGLADALRAQKETLERGLVIASSGATHLDAKEFQNGDVVEIKTPKANVRRMPREDSEVLMALSEGSKLLVERALGDWNEITAPNGGKAFISSSVIRRSDK